MLHKKRRQNHNVPKPKWLKFTYTGKETSFITKLFKDTNIRIAFTTNNTIGKRLAVEQRTPQCKYNKSGVYQLAFPDYKMKYTGQTGRPFRVTFQEHIRDFKYNNSISKIVQHLIDNKHAIGNMEDIMQIVHITGKGKKLDALESFHMWEHPHSHLPIHR